MSNVICEKVGLDYLDLAPIRHTATQEIAASPDRIFAVLLDGPSWTTWVFVRMTLRRFKRHVESNPTLAAA